MSRALIRTLVLLSFACTPSIGALDAPASAQQRASPPSVRGAQQALLRAHNQHREKHCAPPLRWSDELAKTAQRWADQLASRGCKLQHNQTRFGENLAAGTSGAFSPEDFVQMWYREIADYRFSPGGFSMKTGHFTQLVWRATRKVGCGVTQCKGLEVWVCNYDPPGNVEGQYKDQVLPSSCRK